LARLLQGGSAIAGASVRIGWVLFSGSYGVAKSAPIFQSGAGIYHEFNHGAAIRAGV
jgi:hypothetical protein